MHFGDLQEVGESYSNYNPGLGARFTFTDKHNTDIDRERRQRCSHFNTFYLIMNRPTRLTCNYSTDGTMVTIVDDVDLYTHSTLKSSIQNVYQPDIVISCIRNEFDSDREGSYSRFGRNVPHLIWTFRWLSAVPG